MSRLAIAIVTLVTGCRAELVGGGGENRSLDAPASAADAAIADTAPADAPVDARVCAGGDARATTPDGTCLVLFTTPRPWATAATACTQFGAQLAVIADAATDQVAITLAGTRDVFLGLSDAATEGTFAWADASPLVYTNWRTGEPNDGNGNFPEDCGIINGVRGGQWDDRPCASELGVLGEYPYLCQY